MVFTSNIYVSKKKNPFKITDQRSPPVLQSGTKDAKMLP